MKRLKDVLCSLCAKNLLNSNDIAESEENGIPNLPTADIVHIKLVELDKDVQPSTLNSQQVSQGIISNPLTPARIGLPPPFSVYTPIPARIINSKKDPLSSPQPITLVNLQLTQLEHKIYGKIMAMKSYFMDKLRNIRAEIVKWKNKTKHPTSVDVKVSELQSKIGILETENILLLSCSNKQKLLEVVLEHSSVLIKENPKHVINLMITQQASIKAHVIARTIWVLINPTEKSLNIQKLSTISEIIVKNPRLIDQIMALKQIKFQLLL